MTPGKFRTIKDRCLIPTEPVRAKKSAVVFDHEIAHETVRRSGYDMRQSLRGAGQEGPREWFWVHKSDRTTHFSPLRRPRRREHNEPRIRNLVSIVTREVLEAEARLGLYTLWPASKARPAA